MSPRCNLVTALVCVFVTILVLTLLTETLKPEPMVKLSPDYSTKEFMAIKGSWKIMQFVGTAIESTGVDEDIDKEEKIENHINCHLGTVLLIAPSVISRYRAPSELGYYYKDIRDLFFGYKPPMYNMRLGEEILYVNLEHSGYASEIHFMTGSSGNAYVEISGYFYKLQRISK